MGSENIWVPMEHHEYSDTATIGDPFAGTKEKGEKYFQASGKALAAFLDEVKKFDIKIPAEARCSKNAPAGRSKRVACDRCGPPD